MKALGDRVLVEPIKKEKSNWGTNSKIKEGVIKSVGSGIVDTENISKGDTITYLEGTGIEYGNNILLKERELLVKL